MGIDIGAPIGTIIKSFYDGEIFLFKNNNLKIGLRLYNYN